MANFSYTPNVKCVNNVDTWLEINFVEFSGVMADDIEAISISGPSGLIVDDLNEFRIYEGTKYLLYQIPSQQPEIGTYTFSITIDGETVIETDEQSYNRDIPAVDTETMTPSDGSSVPTGTPFTWQAVADPGYTVYYGIQIRDEFGNYVANARYIGDFEYNVALPAGSYIWQVITMDGADWPSSNNRSNGNWISVTITE